MAPSTLDYPEFISHLLRLNVPVFNLGPHLSNCSVNDVIGHGASTTVFRVLLSPRPNQKAIPMALKGPIVQSISRSRMLTPILESLRQKVNLMRKLEANPNIINFYGIAFSDHTPVPMLMLELAISNMKDYLEERKESGANVGWTAKKRFCSDVADGLYALHNSGVVHGDIEGKNILLFGTKDDESTLVAKISGFYPRESDCNRSFYAPECISGSPADIKSWWKKSTRDNYSYGLVVWQIANDGKEPFDGVEQYEIDALKTFDKDLGTLLGKLPPGTPEAFYKVIADMTRYNPKERGELRNVREIMMAGVKESPNVSKDDMLAFNVEEMPGYDKGLEFNSLRLASISLASKTQIAHAYGERASDSDSSEAAFNLSQCYDKGFGVSVNLEKMVSWAIKAAELGSMMAIYNIASRYEVSTQLTKYAHSLFPWLLKAAQSGHERSMLQVSGCYEAGIGVKSNHTKSLEWKTLYDPKTSGWSPPSPFVDHIIPHRASSGRFDAVKYIIQRKKAENLNSDELTYLHKVIIRGDIRALNILFQQQSKPDVNSKDKDGWTPLHRAALGGKVDIVKALRSYGAGVNAKCDHGMTPLHLAAAEDMVNVVETFVREFYADRNIKDNEGRQPHHYALYWRSAAARFALDSCIIPDDINTPKKQGMATLHRAAEAGDSEEVRIFVGELGADVNLKDGSGCTPLHYAARQGRVEVVRMLVKDLGADVKIKDNNGHIPRDVASNNEIKALCLF